MMQAFNQCNITSPLQEDGNGQITDPDYGTLRFRASIYMHQTNNFFNKYLLS